MPDQPNDPPPTDASSASDQPLAAKLNNYLHTKPEVKIGNPAIIWHRAYWKPDALDDRDWHSAVAAAFVTTHRRTMLTYRGLLKKRRGARLENEQVFRPTAMQVEDRHIGKRHNKFRKIGRILPGESYSFDAVFEGILVTISFEMYEEFWSQKMVLDFSSFENGPSQPRARRKAETSLEFLGRLLGYVTWDMNADYQSRCLRKQRRNSPFDRRSRIQAKRMAALSVQMSECLYDIDRAFFPSAKSEGRPSDMGVIQADSLRFADFIGHSLGLPSEPCSAHVLENMRQRSAPFSGNRASGVTDRMNRGAVFKEEHLDDVIEAAWMAITEINPVVSTGGKPLPENVTPISNVREFCLTLIDRQRALYVSSLGRSGASGDPLPDGVLQPIAYLVLSPHQARWQIGRIIDNLHNLGMFRLAAMHEYDRMEKAQDELRKLEEKVSRFGLKNIPISEIEAEFESILQFNQQTVPVAVNNPVNGLRPRPVRGGLRYRLGWTETYWRDYWRLVGQMQFERIEGFQTYEEFIRRGLSDAFENIKMIRKRVDYLSDFINTRASTKNQLRTTRLLKTGEALAYPAASAALYVIFDGANKAVGELMALAGLPLVPGHWQWGWAVSSVLLGLYGWHRHRKSARDELPTPSAPILEGVERDASMSR